VLLAGLCGGGGGDEVAVLLMPKLLVGGAAGQQVAVRAEVEDAALVEHQDGIAIGQRGQPVGDDDHGAAVRHLGEVGVDQGLAFRVERTGRLIEDQDARVVHQRPGDGEALALAAGEVGRAFLDHGGIAVG